MGKESGRIKLLNDGQLPQHGYLSFQAISVNAKEKLDLVKEVMLIISEYDETNWPSDEFWDKDLPSWFLKKIKSYSLAELNAKSWLWDYGSWLDAMKYRGWEWYSSWVTNNNKFGVILIPLNLPFSIDPLEYLIFEAGVEYHSIIFTDHST